MDIVFLASAFSLGFLGSFHCVGMCGPIALMLPQSKSSTSEILVGRLLYNFGRVFTYIVLGFLIGLLGFAVKLKGFQNELSVLTGVIILMVVLFSFGKRGQKTVYNLSTAYMLPLRNILKKLFARKSFLSMFSIGVINGLLPCGFVYLAVAGAVTMGSATSGILYMLMFGLGTFPIMMMISLAANYVSVSLRGQLSKLSPVLAIVVAILLIYRGSQSQNMEHGKEITVAKIQCVY
jgi:sulfite exporter TauE/SafE